MPHGPKLLAPTSRVRGRGSAKISCVGTQTCRDIRARSDKKPTPSCSLQVLLGGNRLRRCLAVWTDSRLGVLIEVRQCQAFSSCKTTTTTEALPWINESSIQHFREATSLSFFALQADAASTRICLRGHRREVLANCDQVSQARRHASNDTTEDRSSEVLHGSPSTHLCRVGEVESLGLTLSLTQPP